MATTGPGRPAASRCTKLPKPRRRAVTVSERPSAGVELPAEHCDDVAEHLFDLRLVQQLLNAQEVGEVLAAALPDDDGAPEPEDALEQPGLVDHVLPRS